MEIAYEEKISELWASEAEQGRIFWTGELTDDLGMFISSHLDRYERDDNLKTVLLDINTPGGCAFSMWSIIDRIRSMNTVVATVCSGRAMSAGFMVLASGRVRLCYPHSRLLFHGASCLTGWLRSPECTDLSQEYAAMDEMMCQHLAKVTKKKATHWRGIVNSCKDRYISAQEALEWGVIDEIL